MKKIIYSDEGCGCLLYGFLAVAFLILFVFSLLGCAPVKRTVSVKTEQRSDLRSIDSLISISNKRLNMAIDKMQKIDENISEWLNENISYIENRYDTTGRLVSQINQTTKREGGKNSTKNEALNSNTTISALMIDSIVSVKITQKKNDLLQEARIKEKIGLMWWQKTLMWIGVLALIGAIVYVIIKIKF